MNARVAVTGCALAAALSAAAASAANPPPVGPIPVNPGTPAIRAATATLSSARAGAKPVALTVKLHYEMMCGQPGPGTAVVRLPRSATVPQRIDPSAVLVNGKRAPSVSVSGHEIGIAMPPPPRGVSCMLVGPGTLEMTVTRAAGLGNPTSVGTYTIRVQRNARSFRADIKITA